ncbi:hypothetical protein GGI07_002260 [Coemansia sp. Benny D115]|nr:hypothetical protein GGI07_002260 [Coemansia sp. Benny D115]
MRIASVFTFAAAFTTSIYALPSHRNQDIVVPVDFANALSPNFIPLASNPVATNDPHADRAARRDERRKQWEEWAHQQGENGVPNGTNFIGEILNGVSGIVDSALGPVYTIFGAQ